MPTERYFNLPKEKRQRIIDAAVEEIRETPVSQLSINRIIQRAEIPRGSFYQYFEDKNDLLRHMITEMQKLLVKRLRHFGKEENGDILRMTRPLVSEIVEFFTREEYYPFFRHLVPYVLGNGDFAACMALFFPHVLLESIYGELSWERYKENGEEFRKDLSETAFSIVKDSIIRILMDMESKENEFAAMERKLNMLERGVCVEKRS